jgi:branched-subunit amino acid transport protein
LRFFADSDVVDSSGYFKPKDRLIDAVKSQLKFFAAVAVVGLALYLYVVIDKKVNLNQFIPIANIMSGIYAIVFYVLLLGRWREINRSFV